MNMLCDNASLLFTQDGEIARLETQLQQRQDYIREKVTTYIYTYKYITLHNWLQFNLNL